ncbi:MAG: DNA methyltransferase [Candidatus Cryptobacteroides sp.]
MSGGGYCQPQRYEEARTAWFQPINAKDKKEWGHPTIKPLNIIQTLVANSSKIGDTILDCFMGSGTTGVACARMQRNFIGMELNADYYSIAEKRIKDELQPTLFNQE